MSSNLLLPALCLGGNAWNRCLGIDFFLFRIKIDRKDSACGAGYKVQGSGYRAKIKGDKGKKRACRLICRQALENSGADERTRTAGLLITNQLLYQLSYVGG